MIIREWRARAHLSRAQAYPQHFESRVRPELARIPGFLGASLRERRVGELVEFLVLTRWASLEAIRAFAGADIERAVVDPAAQAALASFDTHVHHYEVLPNSGAAQIESGAGPRERTGE